MNMGKGNTCSLLVRMQTGVATMEVNVEVPLNARNRSTTRSIFYGLYSPKDSENLLYRLALLHLRGLFLHTLEGRDLVNLVSFRNYQNYLESFTFLLKELP